MPGEFKRLASLPRIVMASFRGPSPEQKTASLVKDMVNLPGFSWEEVPDVINAIDPDRFGNQIHPEEIIDLGRSTQEYDEAIETFKARVKAKLITAGVAAKYIAALQEQRDISLQRPPTVAQQFSNTVGNTFNLVTRRSSLIKIGGLLGATALIGIGGMNVYNNYWTPEALERARLESEAKALEEKRRNAELEKTNTLGLEPSAWSKSDWRIRYPALDPKVTYTEIGDKNMWVRINGTMWLPTFPFKESVGWETNIRREFINRQSDGVKVPRLEVQMKEGTEPWYLRDTPTGEIDTSVVVFENRERLRYYLSFRPTKGEKDGYELKMMLPQ